ncbi:hypothetical protein N9406_09300 [Verrucomicrobiales bacterium]|jgi:hypothetical protein|nr:hypothetical protein [Verrucomicrobiales bacterium]MDB3941148.1 hypothetical protein [Verrucomicrobiales bacterium]
MRPFLLSLSFLFLFTSFSCADESDKLMAGTAEVDISPTVTPFQLRSGPSYLVHDPLHVRAVAFQNGKGRAVIALMDAIGVGREMTDEAKVIAAEKTGWKPEEMLVSGTHTHTAPKGGDSSPGRIAYEKRRKDGLAEALIEAIESLEPAKVGFASDEEPTEVFNRRWYMEEGFMPKNPLGSYDKVKMNPGLNNLVKPAGPTDPEVAVIDVRDQKGQPLGLIANYALHYVGGVPRVIDEKGREVGMASADYFGEFARIMPYRLRGATSNENFVAMMTNGTSGDINNIDFYRNRGPRAPFEQIRVVAGKTADAAYRALQKIDDYDESPIVAMKQRIVTIHYRKPKQEDIDRAIELMKLSSKERNEINSRTSSVAQNTLRFSEPEMTKTEDVIIQAIRIGDQAIVSMPFEVLVEIGMEIKEKSPFPHTLIIELANGGYGYLPPPHQHKLGGYETWLGTSRFVENTSVVLTKNLFEMLAELENL